MAKENQIIITVEENDDQVQVGCDMNVYLSNYGKCAVIQTLLKSLNIEIDWANPLESAEFSFMMYRCLRDEDTTEISMDKSLIKKHVRFRRN